jgi:hypothetical protein
MRLGHEGSESYVVPLSIRKGSIVALFGRRAHIYSRPKFPIIRFNICNLDPCRLLGKMRCILEVLHESFFKFSDF